MRFIQARHFKKGRSEPVSMIVLHTMEWAETTTTAIGCSTMFASDSSPVASSGYCADAGEVIQCVKDEDTAFGVKGGDVNDRAVSIEMAGYAAQTPGQWNDLYSLQMLERVAALVARLCDKFAIPPVYLQPNQVKSKESGITTHRNCTIAYAVPGGHSDPGPNFPMADFLAMVQAYQAYPEADA